MILFILIVPLLGIVGFLVYSLLRYRKLLTARIAQVTEPQKGVLLHQMEPQVELTINKAWYTPLVAWIKDRRGKEWQMDLSKAGIRSDKDIFKTLATQAAFIVAALFAANILATKVLDLSFFLGVFFTLCGGWLIGNFLAKKWLEKRYKTYRQSIAKSLPDMFTLLQMYLESGFSIDMALNFIKQELAAFFPEIVQELDITITELRLFSDRREAWKRLSDRVSLSELNTFVSLIEQSEKFGTPLTTELTQVIKQFRRERIAHVKTESAKAPTKLIIVTVFFFLPVSVALPILPIIINMAPTLSTMGF